MLIMFLIELENPKLTLVSYNLIGIYSFYLALYIKSYPITNLLVISDYYTKEHISDSNFDEFHIF